MQLQLRWRNTNGVPTTVSIYRNDTVVSKDELGEPLVTLAGTVLEWIDTTVIRNKIYYYTWATSDGVDTIYSQPFKVEATYYTGPGPTTFKYGNETLGYYGMCTWQEMFNAVQLQEVAKIPALYLTSNIFLPWFKFSRNGKTLFIPRSPGYTNGAYRAYQAGCHFGVDGPGPFIPAGVSAPVNQLTVIEKGVHRFIIRLMTGVDDRNGLQDAPASLPEASRRYSESMDLFGALMQVTSTFQRLPRVEAETTSSMMNGYNNGVGQERQVGGYVAAINHGSATGSLYPTTPIQQDLVCAWVPVLELIPNKLLEVVL